MIARAAFEFAEGVRGAFQGKVWVHVPVAVEERYPLRSMSTKRLFGIGGLGARTWVDLRDAQRLSSGVAPMARRETVTNCPWAMVGR